MGAGRSGVAAVLGEGGWHAPTHPISHRNLRHIIASKASRKPIQISTLGKFDPLKTIKRTKAPKRRKSDWVSPKGLP